MSRGLRYVGLFVGTLVLSTAVRAEDIPSAINPENGIKPGHSYHGEAFDEGPRRAAYLMRSTGAVSFPVTTSQPQAQDFVNQGIGQLHGFWYFEAERSFRQALVLDPGCAMAYWGMALANVNNTTRAKSFMAEAMKRKETLTPREKIYVEALDAWYKADAGDDKKRRSRQQNYLNALENIVHQFPEDLEARAMLGLALWQGRGDVSITSYFAIDALLNDVLTQQPRHPVHHYRIHLWDNDKARQAVNSAELCGLSAPGIAHMWHMSGHTYSDLKDYRAAAWHQEASARTDHAYMMRDRIFPDAIHNFAHNNEWLVRNLQSLGRIHDAVALARNTIELPRHPRLNSFPGGKSAHYGRLRLSEVYSRFELWDALLADTQTQYLGPVDDPGELVKRLRWIGRAQFSKGDAASGKRTLDAVLRRLNRLRYDSDLAVDKAAAKARSEGKDAKAIEAVENQARQPNAEKIRQLERAEDELVGYVLLSEGNPAGALERFRKATGLGDEFLARIEFEAGRRDEAIKSLRNLVGQRKNEALPLAALVELLWKSGNKDEARKSFEELRAISGSIDRDIPPFARLDPIAVDLGLAADWKQPIQALRNQAELPALDSLGPLHWSPSPAADWTLPDADGKPHALANYQGQPVVVIFYLGYGCLHCAQQLQGFAPKAAEFSQAGISLIAVSTDSVADLKKSHERYTAGKFPFPLVSDESMAVFRQYQAFDDFENVPLHGTFLIDGQGRIRWFDIGAEPFMDVGFVLRESRRLLHPNVIEEVSEPEAVDGNRPASALEPRNVHREPVPATPPKAASAAGG